MNDTHWCDWARVQMTLRRISVTDVARTAGVSRVTVSKTVNGRPVSDQTWISVNDALRQLIREKSDNQSA